MMISATPAAIRKELLERLAGGRRETDTLFEMLTPEALYERPIPERHRVIFYIGHLEAFDWNLLRNTLGLDRFHPALDQLFAFGIDPVDGGLPTDVPSDWPTMSQLERYRSRIRQELDAGLADAVESKELVQLLNIAVEHRLMHAETLEYMFHQLPYEAKRSNSVQHVVSTKVVTPEMVAVPAGTVTLGLRRSSGQFGWDNEFEARHVEVPAFSMDQYKVSNFDFLKFVEAGGYAERSYWSELDWEWKTEAGISHPVFWIPTQAGFRYRSMFDEVPLALNAPVYVSHAEAVAYARWSGQALPTEAEWQRAAIGAGTPKAMRTLWDPPAAGSSPELKSEWGVEDLYGTGWEWTSTPFAAFPGFQIVDAYPGYSANFFDGKHFVMKGGSPRTATCMLRSSFRNWFQAHYQYVYAGFRCVTRPFPWEETKP